MEVFSGVELAFVKLGSRGGIPWPHAQMLGSSGRIPSNKLALSPYMSS